MEPTGQPTPQQGTIPVEKIQELREGMTEGEVRDILGPPKCIQSPDASQTPTEFFQALGLEIIDFAACRDLDAVWVYYHDRRKQFQLTRRIVSYVGFRNGRYTGHWQDA